MAPEVEILGDKVGENKAKVNVIAVNMSKTMKQNWDLEIESFPTIRLYEGPGDFITYDGERTADGFADFLKDHDVKM